MAPRANKKVANSLVTLSSAAIVVVYAAGFMRTKAAAERLEEASNERRPPMPAPSTAGESRTPERIEPPTPTPSGVVAANTPVSPVMPRPDGVSAEPAAKQTADKPTTAAETHPTSAADTTPAAPTTATEASAPTSHANGAAPVAPAADAPSEKAADKPVEKAPGLLYPKEHYNDGTYLGWGTSRHGDIQASITITNGRITAASIAQCWTRYSCSWVAHLPPQVVARQSPECDYVSGATQSANAFYWAVVDALNKAK